MAKKELHITIGSSSSSTFIPSELDAGLRHDTELAKMALLYGDKVKLCSPFSSTLDQIQAVSNTMAKGSIEQKTSALLHLNDIVDLTERDLSALQALSQFISKKHPTPKEIIGKKVLEKGFNAFWKEFESANFRMPEGQFVNDLLKVSRLGLLQFQRFHMGKKPADKSQTLSEFTQLIRASLADESTYPLLDDQIGLLISIDILQGTLKIPDALSDRSRQTALVSRLFEQLPQFELASLNEIVDIRSELEKYLVRFRSAIINYSEEITSAPWNSDFSHETEQLFRKEVAPIIQDIEDHTRSNSFLAKLTKRYAEKPSAIGIPVFSIGVTQMADLPEILAAVFGLTSIAANVYDVFNEWRQKKLEISQNQLFFYYAVKRKLK
jgi:hypothetical protein